MKSHKKLALPLTLVFLVSLLLLPVFKGIAEEPSSFKEIQVNNQVIEQGGKVNQDNEYLVKLTVSEPLKMSLKDTDDYEIKALSTKEQEELDFNGYVPPVDTDDVHSFDLMMKPTTYFKVQTKNEAALDLVIKANIIYDSGLETKEVILDLFGVRDEPEQSTSSSEQTTTTPEPESSTEPEAPETTTESSSEPSLDSSIESIESTTEAPESTTTSSVEPMPSETVESSTETSEVIPSSDSSTPSSTEVPETNQSVEPESSIKEESKVIKSEANQEKQTEAKEVNQTGSITIKAINKEIGTMVPGGTYQILTADGSPIAESTYQIDRELTVDNLPLGQYQLKEVNTPLNFNPVDEAQTVNLTLDSSSEVVTFESEPAITAPQTGELTTLYYLIILSGALILVSIYKHEEK